MAALLKQARGLTDRLPYAIKPFSLHSAYLWEALVALPV
jgi:hypothetical protein